MKRKLKKPYARITVEILEQLACREFIATELRLILAILRDTFGSLDREKLASRDRNNFSLTRLTKKTGISKRQVRRVLDRLIADGVLIEFEEATFTAGAVLGIQDHTSEWRRPLAKSTDEEGVCGPPGEGSCRPPDAGVCRPPVAEGGRGHVDPLTSDLQTPCGAHTSPVVTPTARAVDTHVDTHVCEAGILERSLETRLKLLLLQADPSRGSNLTAGQRTKLKQLVSRDKSDQRKVECLRDGIAAAIAHSAGDKCSYALQIALTKINEPEPEPAKEIVYWTPPPGEVPWFKKPKPIPEEAKTDTPLANPAWPPRHRPETIPSTDSG